MGLFNRPTSTAAAKASGSDGPVDMFSHSQSYSEILAERAERERRRKEKAEKHGKSEGKRKSDEGVDNEEESPKGTKKETPKKKRKSEETPMRRISGQDVGSLLKEAGLPTDFDEHSEDERIVMEEVREKSESPLKARRTKVTRASSRANGTGHSDADAIELGGSSSDEGGTNGTRRSNNAAPLEEEDDESDEELAVLARQARQRRLQRTYAATPDTTKSPTPREVASGSPHIRLQTAPLPDPPVTILIYSQIANTNPLKVYRKLSQNLREIRLAWCMRQGFNESFTDNVFLIHRMRKVYDVTTCKSLGLETDAEGNITMKGAEGKEGCDQVALEAVTQDIYDRMLAEKDREDAKRRDKWDPAAEAGAQQEEAATEPVAEEFIGLVLRARGKPDFKLKVKPTTPFSKIISACRKTFHVADGSTISLEFDGERLEPEDLVSSTDMSDLDVVDVHITSA
ncbi:hypothetical protein MBLNU13_g06958t2 [Cladosporium sp. NU13]